MANFFEAGEVCHEDNSVEWKVDRRGRLSLTAWEAEGEVNIVSVFDWN